MTSRRTTTGASRAAADDTLPSAGSVATPDAGFGAKQSDYAQFIWQKLDSIDGHLKDLSEKFGRLDEKVGNVSTTIEAKTDPLKASLDKVEGKVSSLEKKVLWASALFVAGGFIFSLLFGAYKLFENHISIH
ncbi:hypothetical protein [Paraburkholderia tropica]|uniref:hypothetical protein n=1 Tax=Paraburkholderia tropica TaxID=92647 RepID=UPI002AB78CD8|nr:hypothetical protein [Paraburkholderia tropica]